MEEGRRRKEGWDLWKVGKGRDGVGKKEGIRGRRESGGGRGTGQRRAAGRDVAAAYFPVNNSLEHNSGRKQNYKLTYPPHPDGPDANLFKIRKRRKEGKEKINKE